MNSHIGSNGGIDDGVDPSVSLPVDENGLDRHEAQAYEAWKQEALEDDPGAAVTPEDWAHHLVGRYEFFHEER